MKKLAACVFVGWLTDERLPTHVGNACSSHASTCVNFWTFGITNKIRDKPNTPYSKKVVVDLAHATFLASEKRFGIWQWRTYCASNAHNDHSCW